MDAQTHPVWGPLLEPGRLRVLDGGTSLTAFLQVLTQAALQDAPGAVLWCDGAHAFNPAAFAELNLTRGRAADEGADRVLVKRCMTPFQWDSTLTEHLDQRLQATPTRLVVVHPFDALWRHDEIADWEQEDYTRFSVRYLHALARRHAVPILLGSDLARLSRSHPALARLIAEGVDERWRIDAPAQRFRAVRDDGTLLDPTLRRTVTLLDYLDEPQPLPVIATRPGSNRANPRRTRLLHPL